MMCAPSSVLLLSTRNLLGAQRTLRAWRRVSQRTTRHANPCTPCNCILVVLLSPPEASGPISQFRGCPSASRRINVPGVVKLRPQCIVSGSADTTLIYAFHWIVSAPAMFILVVYHLVWLAVVSYPLISLLGMVLSSRRLTLYRSIFWLSTPSQRKFSRMPGRERICGWPSLSASIYQLMKFLGWLCRLSSARNMSLTLVR